VLYCLRLNIRTVNGSHPACVHCRHARRHPGHLQDDAARQASDDVQCDAQQGDPAGLQEVHERRECPWPAPYRAPADASGGVTSPGAFRSPCASPLHVQPCSKAEQPPCQPPFSCPSRSVAWRCCGVAAHSRQTQSRFRGSAQWQSVRGPARVYRSAGGQALALRCRCHGCCQLWRQQRSRGGCSLHFVTGHVGARGIPLRCRGK